VRRLGARRWQALHRLAYPLTALGLLHFFIQSRADVTEPVITAGCFLWLMGWRLLPRRWQGQPLALLLLAPLAGLATAGVEYAWYALATGLPAARILAANLDVEFGFRPAVWVLCVGLGLAALAALRGLGRRLAAFSAAPAAARATVAPARKPAGAASSPG
jgi:sulfoxide reductase heme-binding subunit YedZ